MAFGYIGGWKFEAHIDQILTSEGERMSKEQQTRRMSGSRSSGKEERERRSEWELQRSDEEGKGLRRRRVEESVAVGARPKTGLPKPSLSVWEPAPVL